MFDYYTWPGSCQHLCLSVPIEAQNISDHRIDIYRDIRIPQFLLLRSPPSTFRKICAGKYFSAAIRFVTQILSPLSAIAAQKGLAKPFHLKPHTFLLQNRKKTILLAMLGGEIMRASCGTRSGVSQLALFRCFRVPV